MSNNNLFIYIPALLVAFYQTQILWKQLPDDNKKDSLIDGDYTNYHLFIFVVLKYSAYLLFLFQLSLNILPIFENLTLINTLQILGSILIFLGFIIIIISIKTLKESWSSMMMYRIKRNQKLISQNIYKYVRHPIYCGIILEVVGYELLINSWLFIFFLIGLIIVFNYHIKNEEELLINHFGKKYIDYKNSTKKLIPFVY